MIAIGRKVLVIHRHSHSDSLIQCPSKEGTVCFIDSVYIHIQYRERMIPLSDSRWL